MTEDEYRQRKAELYAEAAIAKDNLANPQAAYFAHWLCFFMDEQARARNDCENMKAAARYLANQLPKEIPA